jgi:hypothetical protein
VKEILIFFLNFEFYMHEAHPILLFEYIGKQLILSLHVSAEYIGVRAVI